MHSRVCGRLQSLLFGGTSVHVLVKVDQSSANPSIFFGVHLYSVLKALF
jgi:hypothetical protein